jgi:hypothetical protein
MTQPNFKHTEEFLSRLVGVKSSSSGWEARCPCRDDDKNPSLSVAEDANGTVLVHCHRGNGCGVEKICSSVGLKPSDLYPVKIEKKLTLVKEYDYLDEHGTLLFQKLRYVNQWGAKTFRQRKPSENGDWVYSLGDTPKILYNLPYIIQAKEADVPIWLVEGEKDADTLMDMGIVATTAPGGAGKWLDINTQSLAGATVEIVADNDSVGKAHAIHVCEQLRKAGCNATIFISPYAKDVTDHIQAGHSLDELEYFEPSEFVEEIQEVEQEIEQEKDKGQEILDRLSKILDNGELNTLQKIVKASTIISSFSTDKAPDPGRLVEWQEFLAETDDDTYEWIIPGLLEKSERVIVVAAEGVGKTMLARQVAICSMWGIHPFTYQPMDQVRTLTIDLENPERIIRRTSRAIGAAAANRAKMHRRVTAPTGSLVVKPDGLDLLKASDRLIIEEHIEKTKPQLVVIGPLYKAFVDPGGRTSESVAVEVAKYLDYLRTTYGCALWMEHHAPLGSSMSTRDLRPFGSAVWSRWPEFGISLTPDFTASMPYVYDVKHFRGARDERHWPTKITRGKEFPFQVIEFAKVSGEQK